MKKYLSAFLAALMMFSSVAMTAGAAGTDTAGDTAAVVMDDTAASDKVNVKVTAKNSLTGKEELVAGATVRLYVGTTEKVTAKTNSEGIAVLSLDGLSLEERLNATICADKVVAAGKGIGGSERDGLFGNYPKDTEDIDGDGDKSEYIRYITELHSETLDKHGNWVGVPLPESFETNKIDMVFVIDATGSMGDEIDNVKNNLADFASTLISKGLDIRFSIIDYRDTTCGEPTIIHKNSFGSIWYSDLDSVRGELSEIIVDGGGDEPETLMDALGEVAASSMSWRSDAYKFAFVLTDAGYKTNNRHGYSNMNDIAAKLDDLGIVTSVICPSDRDFYRESGGHYDYNTLYNKTGGIYANIYASNFKTEMLTLADSIVESVTRDVALTLSEPRVKINVAVSYYCPDDKEISKYESAIHGLMSETSYTLAQATDGHVFINEIITEQVKDRKDFYIDSKTGAKTASMADLRIEAYDGEAVTIGPNAHINGYYGDRKCGSYEDKFDNLSEGIIDDHFIIREQFYRIQFSINNNRYGGSLFNKDGGYNVSGEYDKTLVHELGHYFMGLWDEYINGNDKKFSSIYPRPSAAQANFGLMDSQYGKDRNNIELSIDSDYSYVKSDTPASDYTIQYAKHRKSAHSFLENRLEKGYSAMSIGKYTADYTGTASNHRYADYPEAKNVKYVTKLRASDSADVAGEATDVYAAAKGSKDLVADVAFGASSGEVIVSITSDKEVFLYHMAGDEPTAIALTKNEGVYTGKIAADGIADTEFTVVAKVGEEYLSNTYTVTSAQTIEKGFLYESLNNKVVAYFVTNESGAGTVSASEAIVKYEDYVSVNDITVINSVGGVKSGEIYSVAGKYLNIDYSTLSWFYGNGGTWTKLETSVSIDEDLNIEAVADLCGNGMYVLMAKEASGAENAAVTGIKYTQSNEIDALVTLEFTDPNVDTKYYNIYYSEEAFTDITNEDAIIRKTFVKGADITLDLKERGKTFWVAIETVSETGTKSKLSEIVSIVAGEADSDGDGIPDWYCDKYRLWGAEGEVKDIANSDDDGDGLTNLEEYKGGSDPTNPNDPKHTTNVAVESITLSSDNVAIGLNAVAKLTATITPDNASNKNITWSVADSSVAAITAEGAECTVRGVKEGVTTVYAVTADGGYSARAVVTVDSDYEPGIAVESITVTPTVKNVNKGSTITLTAKITPDDAANKNIKWYVEDTSIISITPDGETCVVKGLKAGKTTVFAASEDGSHSASAIITVKSGGGSNIAGMGSYRVKFETNGGSAIRYRDVKANTPVTKPADPTKKDCVFDGWYIDEDFKTEYDFSARVTKGITLYAKWTPSAEAQIILTIGKKDAMVFGKKVTNDVAPKIVNSRTVLPIRFIIEALEATIEWDGDKRTVTIKKDDTKIVITIDSDTAVVNGEEVELDCAAFIENGRTYLPLRFVSEKLNVTNVEWDGDTQTVTITR